MLEQTHGEDDDGHRPSREFGVAVLSRPAAVKMQECNQESRLVGDCGMPIWKSSTLKQASLQVSPDMAYQEFNPNRIEGCLAPNGRPNDTKAKLEVSPQYARHDASKSNFFMILHPATGNLKKQSIDLHPSVGCFKKDCKE